MNCAAIEDWEHGHELRPSVIAAAGLVAVIAAFFLREHRPILGGAETAGALGLVLLDRLQRRCSPETLRVLAAAAGAPPGNAADPSTRKAPAHNAASARRKPAVLRATI